MANANKVRQRPRAASIDDLQPMLASRSSQPFDSPDWLYELKWGGVRTLAFVKEGKVTLRGRNGRDLTDAYPELQSLPSQMKGASAVLDGEIVGLGKKGYPRLELLRPRLNLLLLQEKRDLPPFRLCYEVTDLLLLDGKLLLDLPLWQRKNLLHTHLDSSPTIQVSDFLEQEGVAFFEAVRKHHLEGIIAKNKFSAYFPGERTRHWLEVPAMETGHYVIGGYTFGGGRKKEPFESLLLGAFQGDDLVYVGRATAGLSSQEGWRTVKLLEGLHTPDCPFVAPPTLSRFSYWCRPHLVCHVRVGERSPQGEFRFAVFVSLRPDLDPQDCRVEPERS